MDNPIVMECAGPCGEKDKQLYPVDIESVTQLWCMECADTLIEKQEEERIALDVQQHHQKMFAESNIPAKIATVVFDDFVTDTKILKKQKSKSRKRVWSDDNIEDMVRAKEKAQKIIEAILDREQVMVVFAGESGTGKTLLEGIILNILLKESLKCQFYHAKQLLVKLTHIDEYQDAVARIALNRLTVIDDLTSVPKTEFTVRAMSDIINTLYMEEKSLIISTNYDARDLSEYIGESSYDRMREGSMGGVQRFNWESFRGKVL